MMSTTVGRAILGAEQAKKDAWFQVAIAVAVSLVFASDAFTPAGIVVWVFYVVAIVLSSLSSRPRLPLAVTATVTVALIVGAFISTDGLVPRWLVLLNRSFGVVVYWSIGLLSYQLVLARIANAREAWVQGARTRLLADLQGADTEAVIGQRLLARLAGDLDARVGAFYVRDLDVLERVAGLALDVSDAVPTRLRVGETLVGEVAARGEPRVLPGVPGTGLRVRSALSDQAPLHVLIAPCAVDGHVFAVLEIAMLDHIDDAVHTLLARSSEAIASAVRAAMQQRRLKQLLAETQRQAEELQAQQEELRVANEELEVQSRTLQESAARLEVQQTELEGTHEELRARNEKVEEHRNELLSAQTELLKRSEELERASRYKSEFLANMSHELRTPLNSSLILAKLLAENRHGNLTADQIRSAETIHAAGSDLLTLINEILDLSRIEAGHLDVLPSLVSVEEVGQILQRFFRPVANEKGLSFSVRIDDDVPASIQTDGMRLQQILRNLLSNAFKFTAQGGVELHVRRSGERVAFAVTDTGEGIRADKLDVIFEAFRQADGTTQRRHGGTGLGLTISRQLAQRMGGDVQVTSELGAGSTFTLTLPREFSPAAAVSAPAAQAEARTPYKRPSALAAPVVKQEAPAASAQVADDRAEITPSKRWILVVEDDLRFAEILRDTAREHGFLCFVATTASEALRAVAQQQPVAVVLDVHLPDGSGLFVLERFKSSPSMRHVPVHVLSAENYMQQALELGAMGYVLKPVEREQLVATFKELEQRLAQKTRKVLIVEDHPAQRESLVALLSAENVELVSAESGDEALRLLSAQTFDCMVLDLNLSDTSGFELLDRMAAGETYAFPPVIVYTGKVISPDEELRLRRYASSIIIKGARSPERLLDEVTLFLHKVETDLPPNTRELLRSERDREKQLIGKRILLAEDDVRNVFALTSYLEPKGVELRIARNGREAVNAIEAAQNDPQKRIELVLMDIMMPEMDGLTAMREIRARPGLDKLPIIALTAKAMPDDREKCLKAGANDYIAKPLDLDKLSSLIKVWMPK